MGASFSDSYSFLSGSDTQMDTIPKNFEFVKSEVDVTNPFPNLSSSGEMPRDAMPGGPGMGMGGGAPPGGRPDFSSMSPPQMSPPTDELSARMEQLRQERDVTTPQPTARIG